MSPTTSALPPDHALRHGHTPPTLNGAAACVGSRETSIRVFIEVNAQGSDSGVHSIAPSKIRNRGDCLHVKLDTARNSTPFSAHLVPRDTQATITLSRAAPRI